MSDVLRGASTGVGAREKRVGASHRQSSTSVSGPFRASQ